MKLWNSFLMMQTDLAQTATSGLVVTIGNFDGVHRGHQKILERVKAISSANDWLAVVVTFREHTAKILKAETPGLLMSVEERCACFAEKGIDGTLLLEFTPELAQMAPTRFLDRLLDLGVRALVVGHDFTFGAGGAGDTNLILTSMQKKGLYGEVVAPVKVQGKIVSSTQIRAFLQRGQVEAANVMLNRPFTLAGIVRRGQGLGKNLGFPTANLAYPPDRLLPKFGAYFVRVILNGEVYYGLANVGCKPTFDHHVPLVEVFIDRFSREIYGELLTVEFLHFLREEQKFASPEALKAQLLRDQKQGEALRRSMISQEACN
ncbi:MAG TPA: bifunctional riboflavin kinase/FAD synthetase [Hydrogenispora sp.]|jgi:riboflavin kinase/FMN adenylyltransferase|nr:bifunctional riboflavin kinase/FAD synthetase [Hydrogenispora sp.]